PLYPLGVLTWLTAVTVAVLAGRRLLDKARSTAAAIGTDSAQPGAEGASLERASPERASLAEASLEGASLEGASAEDVTADGLAINGAGSGLGYRRGLISAIAAGGLLAAAILAGPIGNNEALADQVTVAAMKEVDRVTEQIEHRIRPQQIALKIVSTNNRFRRQLTYAVAYALRADGFQPMVAKGLARQLGDGYWYRGEEIPLAEAWVGTLF